MEHSEIVFDSGDGSRLRLLEKRGDGRNIYENMDLGGRVTCRPEAVDLFPRTRAEFTPFVRLPA